MDDFEKLHILAEEAYEKPPLQQYNGDDDDSSCYYEHRPCSQNNIEKDPILNIHTRRQSSRIRAKKKLMGQTQHHGLRKRKRVNQRSLVCEHIHFKRLLLSSLEIIKHETKLPLKTFGGSVKGEEFCPSVRSSFISIFHKNALGSDKLDSSRRLFYLVEHKNWIEVKKRTESHPQDAKWRDSLGWTVLHRALCDEAPFESVYEIWRAFPAALFSKSRNRKTPLHCAFRWGCSMQALAFLSDRCTHYSSALLENTIDLPTEIIINNVFPYLTQENPLLIQDLHGWTVLHWMVFHKAPSNQIAMIIARVPQALSIVNFDMNTPLHLACHNGGPIETINLLIGKFPAALEFVDKYGRTPFVILDEVKKRRLLRKLEP